MFIANHRIQWMKITLSNGLEKQTQCLVFDPTLLLKILHQNKLIQTCLMKYQNYQRSFQVRLNLVSLKIVSSWCCEKVLNQRVDLEYHRLKNSLQVKCRPVWWEILVLHLHALLKKCPCTRFLYCFKPSQLFLLPPQ